MCIVIDTCTFASVFNKNAVGHREFRPVLEWIVVGKGKIVYGGATYKKELSKAREYEIRFFAELRRSGKVVEVDNIQVDRAEKRIKKQNTNPNFNDPHLLAIIVISKCLLICTKEKKLNKYFKSSPFCPRGKLFPRTYHSMKNKDLLNDKYIADICKPATRGPRKLRNAFGV